VETRTDVGDTQTRDRRGSVAITGIGMSSALGMDAANACAASRAGITRAGELKCMNFAGATCFGRETEDGVPQFVGHSSTIGWGFTGKARLALLASAALQDLLKTASLHASDLASCGLKVNMSDQFIEQANQTKLESEAIPERFEYPAGTWKAEAAEVLSMGLRRSRVQIDSRLHALYFGGHAGFAEAVRDAYREIRAGYMDRCIVGAIDSYVEPGFLDAAAGVGMLKTADNPVGFSPGEAAAFILLEHAGGKRAEFARISASSLAQDDSHQFHEKPAVGSALAAVIGAALEEARAPRPSFVVADLNGMERRAVDWGHAIVKLNDRFAVGEVPLWLHATSFGETGAAAGALAVCVAAKAFQRSYAPGECALISLASDSGARAALVLEGDVARGGR